MEFISNLYGEYLDSDLVQRTEDVLTERALRRIFVEMKITEEQFKNSEEIRKKFWDNVFDYHYMNM